MITLQINIPKTVKECSTCLLKEDTVKIFTDGECEYCKLHKHLDKNYRQDYFYKKLLPKIKKVGMKNKYDCLIGISGGINSSTLLYAAVRKWKLRPLVIHFDNGFNTKEAVKNMDNLKKYLDIDCITYEINKKQYMELNYAFIAAGVPDIDIPNYTAITKLMYETADKYNIKYILNAHDYRLEGSTPIADYTYIDAKYVQSVYKEYSNNDLVNYPLFTFKDQIIYTLKGVKKVSPFYYITLEDRIKLEELMRTYINFNDYGCRYGENNYLNFINYLVLPKYFNIDKRTFYYSAQIRSGILTKEQALKRLQTLPQFNRDCLGEYKGRLYQLLSTHVIRSKYSFERYDLHKWRYIIWILSILFSHTFTESTVNKVVSAKKLD
jgi:hypothetical protein